MKIMKIKKNDIRDVEVYLAGAGNMMSKILESNRSQIGKNNEASALKHLDFLGFKIKEARLGHNSGIKMLVDCTDLSVQFLLLEEIKFDTLKD